MSTFTTSGFFGSFKDGMQTGCLVIFMNLIFLAILIGGGYIAYNNYQLRTTGASTIGTVIRLDESSDDSGTAYSPVFQYQVNGQTYEFESQNATNPPTHRVGDQDTIYYDPTNPEKAQVDSFFDMWLAPSLLICVGSGGVIATNIGVLVWIFWRRRK
ncbi:MAG: hypothetical protein Fur0022_43900 [Anaerolineales bacterium]